MHVDALTPFIHVADVQRSIDFYRHLGLEEANRHEAEGNLEWAFVASPAPTANESGARLMLARADAPVDPKTQGVLFYCWTANVHAMHDELAAADIPVGNVEHPFYMRSGEFRVVDPDGYVLLVGQLDAA